MTEQTMLSTTSRVMTPMEKHLLAVGMAGAQTAYELNNGFGVMPGKPLRYIDDSAGLNAPGARPFKIMELDGFMVEDVINDSRTGLNAYVAYHKESGVVLVSMAGTNGFGSDWTDTVEDVARLGTRQSRALAENENFQNALRDAINHIGGLNAVNKIVLSGQSLAGGMAPIVGMHLAYGNPLFFNDMGITPEKIFVASVNGFGDEYSVKNAGFTDHDIDEFRSQAAIHRVVVHNIFTDEYDLVSQMGGSFSGTNWILNVENARGTQLHTYRAGIAEGVDNLYGDLAGMKSGSVPWFDHDSLSRNLAWLDSHNLVKNNPVSLSWAGYVALLFSQPGESSETISRTLQNVAGMPKPIANVIGLLSEIVIRTLPVTHAAQALSFIAGTYVGGNLIGSIKSPPPVFDVDAAFGPVQKGWLRAVQSDDASKAPTIVVDTNPETLVKVIKRSDGRSLEIHPDGSVIQTHPDFGMAAVNADGSGMLFLKVQDAVSGDITSTTVPIEPGSILKPDEKGWQVLRAIDSSSGLYESTLYQGTRMQLSEIQFDTDASGNLTGKASQTLPIIRQLPINSLALPEHQGIQETFVRIDANHFQVVLRDDDRRPIQVVDVINNKTRSETTYRDGQGVLQKRVTVEQLNAEGSRTTITGEDDIEISSTVVQRYSRAGEIYELEDTIDFREGSRQITVRDSNGYIKEAEAVPLDAKPSQYEEIVRDKLESDIADFLTALRQKDTAGIILSTARITLDYARSQGMVTMHFDSMVADVSSGLALVSSLRSLQSGDSLAKVGGAVGLLNSTNYLAGRFTGSGYLSPAQSATLSQIGAMLSIANLSNLGKMIEAGQIGSAGATVVSAINGVGYLTGSSSALMGSGAVIAINPGVMVVVAFVLDSFLADDPPPPPPQGTASFYRDEAGTLRYRISDSNPLGAGILGRELNQLLPKLERLLTDANAHISTPASTLSLIASRMPTVQISAWPSRDDNGVNNYFFVLAQKDPLRDDPAYVAISRLDLVKLYGETLALPEALVQRWEVDHLRAKFGNDEMHWQTEGEWLRGRSPIERQRSQLQSDFDRAKAQWEAAAKLNLALSALDGDAAQRGNVSAQGVASDKVGMARAAMASAKEAVDQFNVEHPIDPVQAARATAVEEQEFARRHAARETVSLQWMKLLAVDLGNDGVQIIDLPGNVGTDLDSLCNQHVVRFDMDGDGFREATQWVTPGDAILGIDRSGNGLLDNGSELFNGTDTPFDQHGLASLSYFDANGDGLITKDDPAYRQLRLWLDLDGDGSAGKLEVYDLQMHAVALPPDAVANKSLASMAVEAIDLATSTMRFADGSTAPLAQLDLLANTQGLQIVMDDRTGNLNVLHEDGLRENFITLVDDMAALMELQSPTLASDRRAELEALALRYGLNPKSADFASIVQGLRASGQALGAQDTVIYFGDDDVWVDGSVRDRLEQMRISFRKLGDPASSLGADPQLARIGDPVQAQSLGGRTAFDDRWVPSRKLGTSDISSETPLLPPPPEQASEQKAAPTDVYSLLVVTKGAQAGGLVAQTAVVSSDPARIGAAATSEIVFSTAQPVARLATLHVTSDEDNVVDFGYQQLIQDARLALASADPAIRLQMVGVRSASHGKVSMDDDGGRLSFTPQVDFNGESAFTFVLADQNGRVYEREVSVRVQPVNDAPRTAGESIASFEDVPLLIDTRVLLANDTDIEGDSLSVTGIARVALGRAELLANGMIHYTPPSDQYDVTDTLEYIVRDSRGASAVARIRISLAPVDDAPSVVAERIIHAREDQILRIAPRLLLRNDFDVDTDARLGSHPLKISAVGSAEHGTVRMEADGDVVFTPEADFNGDTSFSYTVMDESGLATTGRAVVRIDPVNDVLLAAGEHIDSHEDELLQIDPALLLKNEVDTDIVRGEKQNLAVVAVDQASGGRVQLKDGMIRFTPDANHTGTASFRYLVSDGAGGFASANVDITLAEVNDAPELPPLRISAIEDTELSFAASRLLERATDVDSDSKLLKLIGVGNPVGGTLASVGDQLFFRPLADFSGTASFEYTVADDQGAKTTAIASIDVNGTNDAPVWIAGSRFEPVGNEDQEIRIAESALSRMFWDADGDALRIAPDSLKAMNAGDSIRIDEARRELVFRGAPDVSGLRSFCFAMTDGQACTAPLTINVNLRPVNDAPVVNAVGFQMLEDGGQTDPTKSAWSYLSHSLLLSGASDVDGNTLRIVKTASARTIGVPNSQPVEVINDAAMQRVAIRAPLNYSGAIEFEFTVADGNGGETVQKAYGSVVPVNDVPYLTARRSGAAHLVALFRRVTEYTAWQIDAWDPDTSQTIAFAVERNPLRGSVTISGTSTAPDERGGILASATIVTTSGFGNRTTTETSWFSATDSRGAKAQVSISFTGRYSADPIVVDLGRDGFQFADIDASSVSFNVDGMMRRSAWIAPDDAMLAYDVDGDGRINRLDEIAFGSHVGDPALSDLQALQQTEFDQNQDGLFDANDVQWSRFLLWQDKNGNGVSDQGELRSLAGAGIQGLYLNANVLNRAEGNDVRVRGYTRLLMQDGSLMQAADVWLGLDNPDRTDSMPSDPSMQQVAMLGSDQLAKLLKQLAEAPQDGNRAPLVYGYLPTQFAAEGQSFRLEIAPNFFIDADTADPLNIDARQADGAALPSWLHWNAERLTLEGTPGEKDIGKLQLALTATDRQGASSSVSFTLLTSEINCAPVLNQPLDTIGWMTGADNALRIPNTLFSDPNKDDSLTYGITLTDGADLPSWMSFDAATATLRGNPDAGQLLKPVSLKITATDPGGLAASTIVSMAAARFGTEGNDRLTGSAADEYLWGEGGNDVISGGAGNDTLIGGSGNDVYLFDRGFGKDVIIEPAVATDEKNTIRFGAGISPWYTWVFRDRDSLYIALYDNASSYALEDQSVVTIPDFYKHPENSAISSIEFENGTVWNGLRERNVPLALRLTSGDDVLVIDDGSDCEIDGGDGNDAITTGNGADQIFAGRGNDIISTGAGNDHLAGGAGSDTYIFNPGWGWDDIEETPSASDRNVIRFGDGIRPSDLQLSRNLYSMTIVSQTLTNQIRIYPESLPTPTVPLWSKDLISDIQFANGETWAAMTDKDIAFDGWLDWKHANFTGSRKDDNIRSSWMSSTLHGDEGNDAITGSDGNDQLFGDAGNDVLDGGAGDDWLSGGIGDDVYLVTSGSGKKAVTDGGGIDTLKFNDVASVSELSLSRSGADLLAGFRKASGGVVVKDFFKTDGSVNPQAGVEWFGFQNGSQLSASTLAGAIATTRPGT